MSWAWTPGVVFNFAGAIAVVLFGVLVAAVRPRTLQSSIVAAFLVAFGVSTGFANLAMISGPDESWTGTFGWVAGFTAVANAAAVLAMAWVLPSPIEQKNRRLLAAPGAMSIAMVAFIAWRLANGARFQFSHLGPGLDLYSWILASVSIVWLAMVWLYALRFRHAEVGSEVRRQAPLLAAGLVIYPASNTRFLFADDALLSPISALSLALVIVAAFAWLWAGHMSAQPRTGRNLCWWILGVGLVGLIDGLVGGGTISGGIGVNGIARLLTVGILSYAVVRHRALGIDAKLRFGISKSTVAAVFIAVFFVVSEAAQEFFGEAAGSQYLGIAAAGGLLFVLAPLQRAADQLAERAVPIVGQEPAGFARRASGAREAERVYRNAVRLALRDRAISADERVQLAELADQLGIAGAQATRIIFTVEAESAEDDAVTSAASGASPSGGEP